MGITTATLGFVGLAAVAVITIVLAWRRQRMTASRLIERGPLSGRRGSRPFTNWFASDPVLFTGGDAGSADAVPEATGAGGGGDCD